MEKEKKGFFKKLVGGLSKTRDSIAQSMDNVFKSFRKIDEDLFEELEEALILADCGAQASLEIVEQLRQRVKREKLSEADQVRTALADIISEMLINEETKPLELPSPTVMLVIGVNGVGKTTTIGKLAAKNIKNGKSVMLAAADTFRAAAIDQLEVWANRSNCPLIKHQENSDPAAVVFDACQSARAKKADLLIIDTAGRLHNKKNLMEELRKISKVVERELPGAHRETILVLDATTGQNAISQAKTFSEIAEITGIALTKLDGTAKGGIVLSIATEMSIPVRFIGVGEQVDDLQEFNAKDFARGLFYDETRDVDAGTNEDTYE